MSQQEQIEISQEEFKSWTENKITQHVVKQVVDARENLKNYLAGGSTLSKDADYTVDRVVGRIEGVTELFNLFTEVKETTDTPDEYGH